MPDDSIKQVVQLKYGEIARSQLDNDSAAVRNVAAAFGYSANELASLPPEANMGLSCGNPVAVAGLREGEVVVDLGSGGGLDVLLAARQVGPTGKAIGIDMTPDMIERARSGAKRAGVTNAEFHLAEIDALPLEDAAVDCILSNCVVNLAPDKPAVFREMLRVLKPGGRVAISDIALRRPLPEAIAQDLEAYVGCVAGALLIEDYRRQLRDAGFESITVTDTGADLNAYMQVADGEAGCSPASCCCSSVAGPAESFHAELTQVLQRFNANDYAASVRVHAVKSQS